MLKNNFFFGKPEQSMIICFSTVVACFSFILFLNYFAKIIKIVEMCKELKLFLMWCLEILSIFYSIPIFFV